MKRESINNFMDEPISANSDKNIEIEAEGFRNFRRMFVVRCVYMSPLYCA